MRWALILVTGIMNAEKLNIAISTLFVFIAALPNPLITKLLRPLNNAKVLVISSICAGHVGVYPIGNSCLEVDPYFPMASGFIFQLNNSPAPAYPCLCARNNPALQLEY